MREPEVEILLVLDPLNSLISTFPLPKLVKTTKTIPIIDLNYFQFPNSCQEGQV